MTTESNELEHVLGIARDVTQRASDDPAFRDQLYSDPAGTLAAAGMPPEAIARFLVEEGMEESDVTGYLQLNGYVVNQNSSLLRASPFLHNAMGGCSGQPDCDTSKGSTHSPQWQINVFRQR